MLDFKFNWDPMLELNIPLLDAQHQQLFKIGRDIEQHLLCQCAHTTTEDLLKILYSLRDYVTYHFFEEEKYMNEIHYPQLESHRLEHEYFKEYIRHIDYEKLCAGPQEGLIALHDEIVLWIFKHMMEEDQKIADFIKK